MMTSTPVTQQQQTDGRTVREVVECNHDLVSEPWCRKIIRQLLQSLELQYAMQMPHRPIRPDTVLVLDSGDPILLPTQDTGAPGSEADDMHDLAAVIHYAITREYPPLAPLRGRVPGEYSPTFQTAIDRCLSPDPAQRPANIEGLRNLLGIVPLGPAIPAVPAPPAASPAAQPEPAPSFLAEPAPRAGPGRLQRRLMLAGAATVLCCAAGALVALLHGADSGDALTLALPDDVPAQESAAPARPLPAAAVDAAVALPDMPSLAGQPQAAFEEGAPAAAAGQERAAVAAAASATYKLLIKPWGMVQVNGVDRGASPPLKRLTLPPGQHTIRIVNPNFPEHTVTVNATKGAASTIELDFTEEVTQ